MCRKRQHHCEEYRSLQDSAVAEWAVAETLPAVLAAWGRFGGHVTRHRYGAEHYRRMGRKSGAARRALVHDAL